MNLIVWTTLFTIITALISLIVKWEKSPTSPVNAKPGRNLRNWSGIALVVIVLFGLILNLIKNKEDIRKSEIANIKKEKYEALIRKLNETNYKLSKRNVALSNEINFKTSGLLSQGTFFLGRLKENAIITKEISSNSLATFKDLNVLRENQQRTNMASEYYSFFSLASDLYLISEGTMRLEVYEKVDQLDTVSPIFAKIVLDIQHKLDIGKHSPFLLRHPMELEYWLTLCDRMEKLVNLLPTINDANQVDRDGWFDAVGRWSVAYEAMYANIPVARQRELTRFR